MIMSSIFAGAIAIKSGPGLSLYKDLWTISMLDQAPITIFNSLKREDSHLKLSLKMELKLKRYLKLQISKMILKRNQQIKQKNKLIMKYK